MTRVYPTAQVSLLRVPGVGMSFSAVYMRGGEVMSVENLPLDGYRRATEGEVAQATEAAQLPPALRADTPPF